MIRFYITKHIRSFFPWFQLAVSDLALMAETPEAMPGAHPGLRPRTAVAMAKGLGPLYQEHKIDVADYMERLAKRIGWKTD